MDIKKYIKSELKDMLLEAKDKTSIHRASGTDVSRLQGVFANLAGRAKSGHAKRKLVTQVIQTLASTLNVTPSDVMKSYRDYKIGAKKAAVNKDEN